MVPRGQSSDTVLDKEWFSGFALPSLSCQTTCECLGTLKSCSSASLSHGQLCVMPLRWIIKGVFPLQVNCLCEAPKLRKTPNFEKLKKNNFCAIVNPLWGYKPQIQLSGWPFKCCFLPPGSGSHRQRNQEVLKAWPCWRFRLNLGGQTHLLQLLVCVYRIFINDPLLLDSTRVCDGWLCRIISSQHTGTC